MARLTVYKHAGYLIPIHQVSDSLRERAERKFTYHFYNDTDCQKCPHLDDRHSETCDECGAYQGGRVLCKDVTIGERTYFSLPFGATDKVEALLKRYDLKVIDKLPDNKPLSRKIRVTVTPHDYQTPAVEAMLEETKGVLKAPPRAGKTMMAAMAICKIGQKTIILASQREWLLQFQETFVGSDTAPPMTNARKTQIGFCKTYEDFKNKDIALATFQQFMNPRGRKLLKRIRSLFVCMTIDEVHLSPAIQTASILASFNARYRFGLTGTTERKTVGLYETVEDLVGPIIHEVKNERLKPTIEVLKTEVTIKDPQGGHAAFAAFINRLETNKKRMAIVAKRVIRAVKAGHTVLLPMQRVKAVLLMVKLINDLADERIALPFTGGLPKALRAKTISAARTGECKVVVGQMRLLSTGLNIPRASCLIEYSLSSNRPQCIQRTARILTIMEGKPDPLVVYVCDDSGIMRKTRRTEWWNAVVPEFKPTISLKTRSELMSWFANESGSAASHAAESYRNGV